MPPSKITQHPRVKLTTSIGGEHGALPEGATLELHDHRWPADVAQWISNGTAVPVDENVPSRGEVICVDATWNFSAQRPPFVQPQPVTQQDIQRQFRWTAEQFATAQHVGFPRAIGARHDRRGRPIPVWKPAHIELWVKQVRELKL